MGKGQETTPDQILVGFREGSELPIYFVHLKTLETHMSDNELVAYT